MCEGEKYGEFRFTAAELCCLSFHLISNGKNCSFWVSIVIVDKFVTRWPLSFFLIYNIHILRRYVKYPSDGAKFCRYCLKLGDFLNSKTSLMSLSWHLIFYQFIKSFED